MAQTRKNGRRAVGKRGNSGRKVTLKKRGRCSGGGDGSFGRSLTRDFGKGSTTASKLKGLAGLATGYTFGKHFITNPLARQAAPDVVSTNNLVRAIALRLGFTPEMVEAISGYDKAGVPKTLYKERNKEILKEFKRLGKLPSNNNEEIKVYTEEEMFKREVKKEKEDKKAIFDDIKNYLNQQKLKKLGGMLNKTPLMDLHNNYLNGRQPFNENSNYEKDFINAVIGMVKNKNPNLNDEQEKEIRKILKEAQEGLDIDKKVESQGEAIQGEDGQGDTSV